MDLNSHLFKKDTQMLKRLCNRWLSIIRHYHNEISLYTYRVAKLKKKKVVSSVDRHVEELELLYCCWKCKVLQALWKPFWQFLKWLNIELPYGTLIPLLGVYSTEMRTYSYKYLYMNVHKSIIHNSQKVEMSINWWMNKQNVVHIADYYSAVSNELLTDAATWILDNTVK